MDIIIAGDGKVGATLTRQLTGEGYDVTVIDSKLQRLEDSVERYDVISVQGNCASMEVLRQAGVESADLLIAATGADEINLLCCTTAHSMNPRLHTIARIRTDYVHELQSRYRTAIEDLTNRLATAAPAERARLNKQLTRRKDQAAELHTYEEKIHHLADQMIAIDLDDGVKHNYAIFQDVLAKIK